MNIFSELFSRILAKKQGAEHTGEAPRAGISGLKMMFFIFDWERANNISGVFENRKVAFHFISKARGTAPSEITNLLGIGMTDKALVTCLEQPSQVPVLLQEIRKNLGSRGPGSGIAFTVPLSGINGPLLRTFKPVDAETGSTDHSSGAASLSGATHSLIIATINHGCSDDLMNTARTAGASGGTVINARSQSSGAAVKHFGISVQDEREMILILTSREKKDKIIQSINENHGLASKAQGIVFSLPVDRVMSLSFEQSFHV